MANHLSRWTAKLKTGASFPLVSAAFFFVLTFALLAELLFDPSHAVWSQPGNDLTTTLVPWWTFGYGQMAHGNFPLWNPHNFCGTPFFTNFNPGMLYPLHLLCLLLPLQQALNWILVGDVFLAGWFTSLWCRGRGVSPLGSIVAGVIYMFSGAYFHHTYAGHEPPLAGMALTPFIFLCVDGIFTGRQWKWALLGMLAVGLQILAGFPQAVYYTGLIAGVYVLLRLVRHTDRLPVCVRFIAIYAGGSVLAAVLLLPGLQTAGESVRQSGNNFKFASISPMPPENFAQLLAPGVLGDGIHSAYFGEWYPWEVSLFCGVTTLVLAGYGALFGDPKQRQFAVTLLVISIVLALGVNLRPVYTLLFHCLPLFSSFRVTARFNWFITLYLAMLAGIGFDLLASRRSWRVRPPLIAAGAALTLAVLAIVCFCSAKVGVEGDWGRFVQWVQSNPDQVPLPPGPVDNALVLDTGTFAAHQFGFSAAVLVVMAAALASLRYSARFRFLLAAITVAELFIFANGVLATGSMYLPYPAAWMAATRGQDRDFRVLHTTLEFPNTAMLYNYNDAYGYDPVTLKRYADLLAMTQDLNPDQTNFVTQIFQKRYPQLFEMLRCHYIFDVQQFQTDDGSTRRIARTTVLPDPMLPIQLIQRYEVAPTRSEVFAFLRDARFDPRKQVILESPPDPAPPMNPKDQPPGWASVVNQSTDWLEIKADLPEPAILLVTDAYSKFWRAEPLEPGPQSHYDVMPANYALRAIPLAAGRHHLLLEYAPIGYKIGKWVSIVSALAWLALMGRPWLTKRSRSRDDAAQAVEASAR
jgi:hypothetical protein